MNYKYDRTPNQSKLHNYTSEPNLTHLPQCRIYASGNRISNVADNGLSPIRLQAIIWTNTGLSWIGPLEINFSEVLFTKVHLKIFNNISLMLPRAEAGVGGRCQIWRKIRELKEWRYDPLSHTSTENDTYENLFTRCQSSVGYLAR